mmetsp:Transcript_29100/g.86095  ORF Transcript_29100/g.86095 Transcript_29100/m.86095 type:complete len:348 (+) Transcript_29100:399-1442(+)
MHVDDLARLRRQVHVPPLVRLVVADLLDGEGWRELLLGREEPREDRAARLLGQHHVHLARLVCPRRLASHHRLVERACEEDVSARHHPQQQRLDLDADVSPRHVGRDAHEQVDLLVRLRPRVGRVCLERNLRLDQRSAAAAARGRLCGRLRPPLQHVSPLQHAVARRAARRGLRRRLARDRRRLWADEDQLVVREGAPVLRAVVAAAVATHAQVEGAVADAAVDAVVEAADSGGAAVAAGLGARQRVLSLLAWVRASVAGGARRCVRGNAPTGRFQQGSKKVPRRCVRGNAPLVRGHGLPPPPPRPLRALRPGAVHTRPRRCCRCRCRYCRRYRHPRRRSGHHCSPR